MKKPVSPAVHGITDYLLSGVEMAAPLFGLNNKAARTYQLLGAGFSVLNALTKTPVGLKKVIPLKTHQKADGTLLAGLALLSFIPFIRKDRKAILFHAGFLAVATLHYLLTDYDEKKA